MVVKIEDIPVITILDPSKGKKQKKRFFRREKTPLIDGLEKWWTPDKFLRNSFTNYQGQYCAVGALNELYGLDVTRKFKDVAGYNDLLGRRVTLTVLRHRERKLRKNGCL